MDLCNIVYVSAALLGWLDLCIFWGFICLMNWVYVVYSLQLVNRSFWRLDCLGRIYKYICSLDIQSCLKESVNHCMCQY